MCSGGAIEEDEVLDLLGALVDKSLVVAGAAAGGAVRYRMLEPIRQYAREKLEESGEAAEVQGRHAAFSSPWQKKPSRSWLDRSRACGWSGWRRARQPEGGLSWAPRTGAGRSGAAVRRGALAILVHPRLPERIGWMERVLEGSEPAASPARVKALEGMGWLTQFQADFGEGRPTKRCSGYLGVGR